MYIFRTIIFFLWIFFACVLQASEVESLLNDYNSKNDLSQKTIDENKGHLVLYTRDKLERMHAKTLKDVFKTTPVVYYHENRYGLPDPLVSGAFEAYRSNFVRLYIDGVEITQGWAGSGLVLYGDVNIDFADHIEFYYTIPSFDTSVEPAYLTIFIYSKNTKRDSGGKLNLTQGSRGYYDRSISYGEQKEKYAYMLNLSHVDAKRSKIDNRTSRPLSRDYEQTQLFSYIKTENQTAHLQIMEKNTDSLAGLSLDATPLTSKINYLNVHADYGIDLNDKLRMQFSYEWLKANIIQEDDFPLLNLTGIVSNNLDAVSKNSTYSAELTYRDILGRHHMTTGIKGRWKTLDSFFVKNIGYLPLGFSKENVFSAFFQDQYELSDAEILTLGMEYSKIYRNSNIEDDDLFQFRLGYIFTSDMWSYKTYLYRTMFALDPFSRQLSTKPSSSVLPQTTRGVTQELGYSKDHHKARLMLLFMQDQDGLVQNIGSGKTQYFFTVLNYEYNYNMENKLNLQLYYARYKDIFNLDKLEDFSGYLSLSDSYEKFDFYNAVVWHKNSLNSIHYFDVTSSISWNINEDLAFTLKGQNLLNRAKETNIIRISPTTGKFLNPISVSPIDQRVTLEMEYTF